MKDKGIVRVLKQLRKTNWLLNGVVGTFHRPHPEKEAKAYQVRDARDFLTTAGVTP